MRKLLLLLVVFGALPLFGQGTSFPVFNRQGWTMAGAVVGTCNGPADPGTSTLYCSSPVATYTDWTLAVPCTNVTTIPNPPGPPLGPTKGVGCTNPGLTDSHGNATIFAANGFYWALISGYQVVPQTFPFNIGAGGGGGGACPAGASNDVQFNENNVCAVDTGIFTHNTTLHVTYDNEFSANNELQVSDPTTTGVLSMGHSNGTSTDFSFLLSLTPTFGASYGLCPPDAVPTGANYHWSISSGTPTTLPNGNSCYPGAWVADGTGASVSLEYLYPLDYTNAPSPTTSSDLTRTLFPQGTSTLFMGPPVGSQQGPFVYQSRTCSGTGSTATCSFPGPSIAGHAYAMMVLPRQGTTVGNPTDSASNTYTPLIGPGGSSPVVAYAANVAAGTPSVPINTISQAFDSPYTWIMVIEEIGDVPTTSPVETHAQNIGGCSGTTLSFASVTTTATDLIVGFNLVNPGGSGGDSVYTAADPWYVDQQITLDTGGLTPFMTMAAIHGLRSSGTITPTVNATDCAGSTVTMAFKDGGLTDWATPRFRYQDLTDWHQEGLVPDPVANAGQCLAVGSDQKTLGYVACGTSSGFVTASGSPVSGNLTKWSGATSVTNGNLSGDATTSGTLATTVVNLSSVTNSSLPNSGLAHPSTTVNGQTCTLGSTCTVTTALCSGTITVNPGALSTNTCSSAITQACSGLATTDNIMVDFNADPTGTTGYQPGTMMTIVKYPTANTINLKVCNNTGGSVTPSSVTVNYRVVR